LFDALAGCQAQAFGEVAILFQARQRGGQRVDVVRFDRQRLLPVARHGPGLAGEDRRAGRRPSPRR
jgi:hypothetical protein